MRSRAIGEYKLPLKLSKEQREVLVGLLLGDGCLETSNGGKTYRLKIEQSAKHRAYVFHLFGLFRQWVRTPPRQRKRVSRADGERNWVFQTLSHPGFRFYGHQFYSGDRKSVPKLIHRWLTPRGLAYWFMDDGSAKSPQSKGVIFNTQGFSLREVEFLAQTLSRKFELETSVRRQPDGFQIYVSGRSYEQFAALVGPYLIEEMRYKLPSPRRTHLPKR